MKSPRLPADYSARHVDCQEDFKPRVIPLIDEGKAAGWSTREVTTARIALADNLMSPDRRTSKQISISRKRSRGFAFDGLAKEYGEG
jgi:hypothetical protein